MDVGAETVPVASMVTTDTKTRSANLGVGVHVKLLFPRTGTDSHPGTSVPLASMTLTVSPRSAVPEICVPLVLPSTGDGGTVITLKEIGTSPVV